MPQVAQASSRCFLETLGLEALVLEALVEMENGPMIRTVVVVGALLLGVGAVMAQQDVVNQSQSVMKANGKNAGALAAMVKGEKPYDQATVDATLDQFADTAKKLPTMFPESTKGLKPDSDYSASSKIWEDKAGFDEHIASFAKVVAEAKTQIKDLETLKTTFPVVGKQCGGCHETYRVKKG
jgi:cytochrome c556